MPPPPWTVSPPPLTVAKRLSLYELSLLVKVMEGVSDQVRLLYIKTIINGWTTSYRMNDSQKHQCLFGCQARDKLRHYLHCQPLWLIIISTMGLGMECLDLPTPSRLGFSSPAHWKCLSLALAFKIYHCLKNQHFPAVVLARESDDFEPVLTTVLELARVHWRDMRV